MDGCAPFDATQGYAIALTSYVDCQAALLGEGGYAALSASTSPIIVALGGMLTIFIALQGYRLLLGDQLHIRDGILLAAKVGLVLAFATQWPAYRTVVYNVATEAPQEVLALLPSAGSGSGRNFPARLQSSYQLIAELTRPSSEAPLVNIASAQEGAPAAPGAARLPVSLGGNPLLTTAGILLLVSGLAVLLSVRLVVGLLLALGPIFFATLLFDTTRGLFEGWVRVLLGAAVASVATGVLLGIEISIVEPQLINVIETMTAGNLPTLAPGEILATILIFTLALLIALTVSLRVGVGFRFLERGWSLGARMSERWRVSVPPSFKEPPRHEQTHINGEVRSRAAMISEAIKVSDRWGQRPGPAGTEQGFVRRTGVADRSVTELRPKPLGETYRRNGRSRRTKIISQRNGQT